MKFISASVSFLLAMALFIAGRGISYSPVNCEENTPLSCCSDEVSCVSCCADATPGSDNCCEVSSYRITLDNFITPSTEKVRSFETGFTIFAAAGNSLANQFFYRCISWFNLDIPPPRSGIALLHFTHTLLI